MTRALLALLLLPAPAFATMTWNPSYDPKFVAAAHAGLTAPLLLDIVCAGPACSGGGGGISAGTNSGDFVWTGKHTWGSAADAANSVRLGETAGAIVGEGATADASETTLAFGDATADNTISFTATSTGVTASTTTGAVQFPDDKFRVCGSADFTKCGAIETDGVTAANTVTFATVGGTAAAPTLGLPATTTLGSGVSTLILGNTNVALSRDSSSASTWNVALGDNAAGHILTSTGSAHRMRVFPIAETLTESTATAFLRIAVASGSVTGGVVEYTIQADDATDFQSRAGVLPFAVVNKAGTETCTIGTVGAATEVVAVSTGTLTNTFDCDTSPTNAVDIRANAVSSLTQTTLNITFQVRKNAGVGVITAQ